MFFFAMVFHISFFFLLLSIEYTLCGSSNSNLRCAIALYMMLISYTLLGLFFSFLLCYFFSFSVYCRHWFFNVSMVWAYIHKFTLYYSAQQKNIFFFFHFVFDPVFISTRFCERNTHKKNTLKNHTSIDGNLVDQKSSNWIDVHIFQLPSTFHWTL